MMKKPKKKKNRLITVFDKYLNKYLEGLKKIGHTKEQLKEDKYQFVNHMLYMIEEQRPDKDKTAYEQANEYQKEYLDYLKGLKEEC